VLTFEKNLSTLISELTYIVVAHTGVQPINTNLCIDWAIEMMELGYETPSLLMLSSFSKSEKYYTSYFEIIEYLNDSIKELGLELKVKEDAVLSFSSYYIKRIAEKNSVRENLKVVYKLHLNDFDKSISDFCLLYWAWQDIDYGLEQNGYWQGVNTANIEETVINVAKE
jgi:hypothetical protein